ncbi:MAG: prolyl oligopeptidase family serine peptidase [Bdellovibrionales bacterium]|nr:prolyl oligopeptidase family serine peptidase [Bdellovibrionales bacterium]
MMKTNEGISFVLVLTLSMLSACSTNKTGTDGVRRPPTTQELDTFHQALDAFLDQRLDGPSQKIQELLDLAQANYIRVEDSEMLLRQGRFRYPDSPQTPGQITYDIPVECYHVDYQSVYHIYIPPEYDSKRAYPLVVVGHGGNSNMTALESRDTAKTYIDAYRPAWGTYLDGIVVAPATEYGWSPIGDSLIFSVISKVSREYHIDADKIYIIGQSMGGHLAWRSGINHNDRYAGIAPQSGGYTDFINDRTIENLFGISGYATWGNVEPYGLTQTNQELKAWLEVHNFPYKMVQKNGGHYIYGDEQTLMVDYLNRFRRNLYKRRNYFRGKGTMRYVSNWAGQNVTIFDNRTYRMNQRNWIELEPRKDQFGNVDSITQAIYGEIDSPNNRIVLTSENVQKMNVLLHPDMGLDLSQPVVIEVNGDVEYRDIPISSLRTLLERVLEFDDRGRIFYAEIPLDVNSSQTVLPPHYEVDELPI